MNARNCDESCVYVGRKNGKESICEYSNASRQCVFPCVAYNRSAYTPWNADRSMASAKMVNPVTKVNVDFSSSPPDDRLIAFPCALASANAAATTPRVNNMTEKICMREYRRPLYQYPMIIDAVGPPDLRMMCSGTEM